MTNLDRVLKRRDITFPTAKVRLVKAMVFPVVMYRCESWTIKKAEHRRTDIFQIVVLKKTLESLLDCKEIKPVSPKGKQLWIFTGWTDAAAEAPILWPPDAKSQLIGKDSDAGNDWRQEEKGMTEDEMVGWHCQLHGHEFEQTPGESEGQRSPACSRPWDGKESHISWVTQRQATTWEKTSVMQRFVSKIYKKLLPLKSKKNLKNSFINVQEVLNNIYPLLQKRYLNGK